MKWVRDSIQGMSTLGFWATMGAWSVAGNCAMLVGFYEDSVLFKGIGIAGAFVCGFLYAIRF